MPCSEKAEEARQLGNGFFKVRFREGGTTFKVLRALNESQGQNLALTVLYVPSLLDIRLHVSGPAAPSQLHGSRGRAIYAIADTKRPGEMKERRLEVRIKAVERIWHTQDSHGQNSALTVLFMPYHGLACLTSGLDCLICAIFWP